jgi:hypothetical protein
LKRTLRSTKSQEVMKREATIKEVFRELGVVLLRREDRELHGGGGLQCEMLQKYQ